MPNWDDPLPPAKWEKPADPERFERMRKQWRDTPAHGILLGTSLSTNERVYIAPEQLSTHLHCVGSTGVGKTSFLEGLYKQLIMQGHGVCVITPHGDLYRKLLEFCAYMNTLRPDLRLSERVIPFDLKNTGNILGFNPVARNARVMSYQVVALMEAIRKCWGQDNFEATPRLARWLYNAGHAIVESGLTLYQAKHMVNPTSPIKREAIIRRIQDPDMRAEWEWISNQKAEKQEERLESSYNRIRLFVNHETLKLIIGQYTNTLDFPAVLDGRKILLVNLEQQDVISEPDQHLLGTLFVNELLTAAFARPEKKRTPFFLCVDEFQHFVTKDMCEILDGGRKFGLYLTLAHQHLNQLKLKEPEVYYSVLSNARTKVVFGGMIDEDLDILAKELYTGELNPDERKDERWHTIYKPVETTRTICVDNWNESNTSGTGRISHESLVSGQVFLPGSGFLSGPQLMSSSEARGRDSSNTRTDTRASTAGGSRSEVPWYEFHEEQELASITFRQLEEQLYIKKAQLKRQPQQHAAVLVPGSNVQLIKDPTLAPLPITETQFTEFLQASMEYAKCFKPPAQAEAELKAMEDNLLTGARETINVSTTTTSDELQRAPKKQPSKTSLKDRIADDLADSASGE